MTNILLIYAALIVVFHLGFFLACFISARRVHPEPKPPSPHHNAHVGD